MLYLNQKVQTKKRKKPPYTIREIRELFKEVPFDKYKIKETLSNTQAV